VSVKIALLRGINVGGNKKVAMADLRDFLTALEFGEPRTLLQSGNAIFHSHKLTGADLESLLDAEVEKRLGLKTEFFVRTAEEWPGIIASNPFPDEAAKDPGRLIVMFMKKAQKAEEVEALQAAIKGREIVRAAGRQAFIYYPDGAGNSKLTINVIEKKLGSRGTGRNWNTVLKLGALVGA
jgi:uncharacterized protein (DUF1697 family)